MSVPAITTPDAPLIVQRNAEWSARQTILAVLLTAVGYWAGAKLGISLTFGPDPVAALWPPNAILLAALLLAPRRTWWLILLGALPAHVAAELSGGVPLPMVLSWFVSNSSEALLGAYLVRTLTPGRARLDSVRAFCIFVLCATIFATFASSFLDAAFVSLNGWGESTYWRVWRIRFFSNVLATQIIVPVVLACDGRAWQKLRSAPARRYLEGVALALGIFAVSVAAFVPPERAWRLGPAILYVPLPLLLWAAVRFGMSYLSGCLLGVTLIALWGTYRGGGPFTTLAPEENAQSVQLFIFLSAAPLSLLAAVIEERRVAEQKARDSQLLLALTINAARVGVWVTDIDAREIWADDVLQKTFGIHPEATGSYSAWSQCIHPDDREDAEAVFCGSHLPGAPRDERGDTPIPEFEFRVLHQDQSVHWVLCRGTVLRREDGTAYRTTGIGLDITERKRSGEALRESDERMALAAATANIGFWSLDVEAVDMWLSEHCYTLLGLTPRTRVTRETFESLIRSPLVGDRREALDMRSTLAHEFRIVRQDGTERWIASSARREPRADGRAMRIHGVIRDITEQRRAEQQARERQRELEHLARVATIGELSATIVHEIGQPIGAVMFNAQAANEMLARPNANPEDIREIVRDILRDNQRAGEVISQLRKLLRRDEVAREPLDIRLVVREALDLAHSELVQKDIDVTLRMSADVPAVMGNRSQLQQVLLNLILNARDAMSEVPPEFRHLRVGVARRGDATVHVSVADSGTGIATDRIDDVFEPFFTSKAQGLGLGLAISRSIMAEHGGDLRAENSDGGAVLHLTLPSAEINRKATLRADDVLILGGATADTAPAVFLAEAPVTIPLSPRAADR